MIVDCAVYEDGQRRDGDLPLAEASAAGRDEGAFVWVGLHEPSADEFDAVTREFDLHELAVEDAIKAHQRPKLEVLEFHRATEPLLEPLERLARGERELVHEDTRSYLRDVHDHLLRVVARIEGSRDLLATMLHANLAQISVRQNEDTRRISAWVAIIATPTMIAGIYGMNFENMPELRWDLGYPLAIAVMVLACTGLYLRFRRSGWL